MINSIILIKLKFSFLFLIFRLVTIFLFLKQNMLYLTLNQDLAKNVIKQSFMLMYIRVLKLFPLDGRIVTVKSEESVFRLINRSTNRPHRTLIIRVRT